MTLAALTPLVTWWPLFFGLLVLIAKVICPRIVRRQSEPPAELVAAISGWPPPWTRGEIIMLSLPPRWTDRVTDGCLR